MAVQLRQPFPDAQQLGTAKLQIWGQANPQTYARLIETLGLVQTTVQTRIPHLVPVEAWISNFEAANLPPGTTLACGMKPLEQDARYFGSNTLFNTIAPLFMMILATVPPAQLNNPQDVVAAGDANLAVAGLANMIPYMAGCLLLHVRNEERFQCQQILLEAFANPNTTIGSMSIQLDLPIQWPRPIGHKTKISSIEVWTLIPGQHSTIDAYGVQVEDLRYPFVIRVTNIFDQAGIRLLIEALELLLPGKFYGVKAAGLSVDHIYLSNRRISAHLLRQDCLVD